jgi:transcriptional regulator with XRE-family HTH domain
MTNSCRRCRKPILVVHLEISLSLATTNPHSLSSLVGNTIRKLRLRHGYSQLTLALKTGTHRTHVSRMERAQVTPTLAVLVRAATALGADVLIRVRDWKPQSIPGTQGKGKTGRKTPLYLARTTVDKSRKEGMKASRKRKSRKNVRRRKDAWRIAIYLNAVGIRSDIQV